MNLTDEDVQEILRLLDNSPYDELKLETDRFKLTLRPTSSELQVRATAGAALEKPTESTATAGATPHSSHATATNGETVDIYPPLPGTFYRAPSPGADPFTEIGEMVTPDTIVGLVETMKLMNSVMAGCQGEVIEICAGNAALVEAGDVIMRIRVSTNG